jgi:hypothetical protein
MLEGCSPAQLNLIETYLALAANVPNSAQSRNGNIFYSVGQTPHPVCNFGIAYDLTPAEIGPLDRLSAELEVFPVYALDQGSAAALMANGFRESHSLVQMEAPPRSGHDIEMARAATPAEKSLVARFMIDQFFPQQSVAFRTTLSESTAEGEAWSIHYYAPLGSVVAGVLLHPFDGLVGIYNLCVLNDLRGRGIGGRMVDWVLGTASSPLCLQCRPGLVDWYQSYGFEVTGEVRAFCR